jgi:hypothetical protein
MHFHCRRNINDKYFFTCSPAGWDNEKKISILYENMASMKPDDSYDEVIAKPVMRKPIQREVEVLAEDEQAFLMKQQMQLTKQAPSGGGQRVGSRRRLIRLCLPISHFARFPFHHYPIPVSFLADLTD